MIGDAPYALHFDSDCIDFADLPICESTDRNVGLTHQTAFQALTRAAAGHGLQAITITQITPGTAPPTAQRSAPGGFELGFSPGTGERR